MKDIKFFGLLSVAALAMSVSSCTNDNEPQVSDNNTENNSGVEGFTIQANIGDIQQTRATVKPEDGKSFTWQSDDKFDLYQSTSMATAKAFAIDNKSITDNGKRANFSCADFTPVADASYYAFYPQGFTTTDNATFTYNIPDAAYSQSGNNSTEHLKAGMIMVATGNSDELANGISFSHKTALFRFGVTNLTGDVVTVKSVKLSSTATQCFARSYSYTVGGSETVGEKSSELNLSFAAGVSVDKNSSLKAYAVAIPADAISAGETFTLEVTYNYGATRTISFDIDNSFVAGHVYSFNIDIKELNVDKIYLAGSAVNSTDIEVTQTLENANIYAFYGELQQGNLYLPIEFNEARDYAIVPNTEESHDINDGITNTYSQIENSNIENNYWTIPSAGIYRIVVNIDTEEITIYSESTDMQPKMVGPWKERQEDNTYIEVTTPVEYLWMWGDFEADAEGNIPSDKYKMEPSKASPYIFTYFGALKTGTVKFQVSNVWNNTFAFGATNIKNQHLDAELDVEYVMVPGAGDNRYSRYKIPAGTNCIIVDITDEVTPTVIFSKR